MTKFGTMLLIIILLCVYLSVNSALENEKEKIKKTICTSCQKNEQHTEKPLGDDGSARQEKSGK